MDYIALITRDSDNVDTTTIRANSDDEAFQAAKAWAAALGFAPDDDVVLRIKLPGGTFSFPTEGLLTRADRSVMWIMGLVPALAFLVASLITALFSVLWGAIVYAGAIYLVVAIILISLLSVRAPPDPMGARKIIRRKKNLF